MKSSILSLLLASSLNHHARRMGVYNQSSVNSNHQLRAKNGTRPMFKQNKRAQMRANR